MSSLFGTLETSKLDRSDVVDPAVATEAGKAADAKKTQDELTRISGVASDAKTLAESKADKLSDQQLEAVNSGIDADKVAKIAQNETAISAEVSRATTEEARLQALVNAIKTFDAVVADSLPTPSGQYSKKLYLVPSTNPETRNVKDEFICVKIEDVWGWEQVGSTAITIEFDNEPTEGSQKAARSGGIWSFVTGVIGSLTLGWEKITGKPSTFPPSEHSHAQSQVTGLAGALAEKLPSTLSKTDVLSVENPDPLALPVPMIEYAVLDLVTALKGWIWNGYVKFANLRGKPTTLAGYGITDAATKADVDEKANSADVPGMVRETMSAEGISGGGIYIGGSVRGQTIGDQYGDLREAINGKADKTIPSANGNLAALTADGNLADSGIAKTSVATKADLDEKLDSDDPILTATEPSVTASDTALAGAKSTGWALAKKLEEKIGEDYGTATLSLLQVGGGANAFILTRTMDSVELNIGPVGLPYTLVVPMKSGTMALTNDIAEKSIPAFSSSSTYEVGEIVIYDGVAYKCVTAITTAGEWTGSNNWTAATDADLANRLKGLKGDGTATDAFATSLLGKQVAKEAVRYAFDSPTSSTTTTGTVETTAVTANSNTVASVTIPVAAGGNTPSLAITVPEALGLSDVRDFIVYAVNADTVNDCPIGIVGGTPVPQDGAEAKVPKGSRVYIAISKMPTTGEWFIQAVKLTAAA